VTGNVQEQFLLSEIDPEIDSRTLSIEIFRPAQCLKSTSSSLKWEDSLDRTSTSPQSYTGDTGEFDNNICWRGGHRSTPFSESMCHVTPKGSFPKQIRPHRCTAISQGCENGLGTGFMAHA
jgi:hypothetical protein